VRAAVLLVAFVGVLVVAACERDSTTAPPTTPPPSAAPAPVQAPATPRAVPTVTFGDGTGAATVRVEVADTKPRVERGLMYRQNLPPEDGMLFLLGIEQDWKFWMRNTLIPLDIIFIKRDLTVAGVSANAEPLTESMRTVGVPSLYVVEVNAGWAAAHHVAAGTPVHVDGVDLHAALR
jgi:uncharacterized membrane protein (UPF0127 family)